MIRWSLLSEYFALMLIVVIMLFFLDKRQVHTYRRKLYWACLLLSAASIVLNIASVFAIGAVGSIPVWAATLLNSAYFVVSILMCVTIGYYILERILEYVFSKKCLRRGRICLLTLLGVNLALVFLNFFTGILFRIDADGQYIRGPLNAIGFATPFLEVILVVLCYVRNRRCAGRAIVRIMWSVPAIVVLLVAYQVAYPDQLLNGAICALANLIIFISFQNSRIERDSLTDVFNRKSLLEELTLRMAGGQRFRIMAVALRQFSRVNQVHGYTGGDAVLIQIAAYLRGVAGAERVFRFSNVEFALLLPIDGDSPAERIRSRFDEGWLLESTPVQVSICMAEVTCDGQDWTPEQIVDHLEYATRLAKEEDRRLVCFDGEIASRHQRREHLIQTLQTAIERGGFEVWYQPVYDCTCNRFRSAEALLRLRDDQGGLIPPDEFIPLAEETGSIDALCWIVLEDVCRLLGSGEVPGLEIVSINLSMQQFLHRDLGDRIEDALRRHNVAPERLKLEITERVLLDDTNCVQQTMKALHDRRLGFYLDDFGTGYSNFSSALDLPFEAIKLDRSLTADLCAGPRAQLMAETLIPFFHKLGAQVVAEGIENRCQAAMAIHYGADRLQGFCLARPMPGSELPGWYREHTGGVEL